MTCSAIYADATEESFVDGGDERRMIDALHYRAPPLLQQERRTTSGDALARAKSVQKANSRFLSHHFAKLSSRYSGLVRLNEELKDREDVRALIRELEASRKVSAALREEVEFLKQLNARRLAERKGAKRGAQMRPTVARVAAGITQGASSSSVSDGVGSGSNAISERSITVEVEERQLDALVERCEKAEAKAAAEKRKAAEAVARLRFVEAELARARRACDGLAAELGR